MEEHTTIRIPEQLLKRIDIVVANNKGLFPTRSLFIRSAINKLLKRYEN